MTDTTEKKSFLQDIIGALVFVAGAFLAVSVAMFWSGGGASDANPTTRGVVAVIDGVGSAPAFLAGIGLAAIGGLAFFVGGLRGLGRHALGAAGLFFVTVVLAGALVPGSGGALGGVFESMLGPGTLARILGAIVGTLSWRSWSGASGFRVDQESPRNWARVVRYLPL